MKTKFDISKNELVELDISFNGSIKSAKYLTISIKHGSDGYIKLLPLKEYLKIRNDSDFIVPCIDMPLSMITGCRKLDKTNLLYLIDSGNPHIVKAIYNLFGA
tara:strand:+ start:1955 stop:2263 length:309 start_codon:yes stop_codon:yes gene_type:complete